MSMNLIFTTSQNKYKYAERYNNYCKCETIWTISVTIEWINTTIQQPCNNTLQQYSCDDNIDGIITVTQEGR